MFSSQLNPSQAKFYVHWMNNKELNFNIASEAFFFEIIEKLKKTNNLNRVQSEEIDEFEIENKNNKCISQFISNLTI